MSRPPQSRMSPRVVAAWVFLAIVGLALRALLLRQYLGSPFLEGLMLDSEVYWEWSGRIASGQWLPEGVLHQGPCYPYLLALARLVAPGLGPLGVAGAQLLANAATALLLGMVVRRSAGELIGFLTAALALLFAPAVFLALKVLSSTLALLTLVLAAVAWPHPGRETRLRAASCGLFLGLSVLTAPHVLPGILAVLALSVIRSLRIMPLRLAPITLIALLVTLSPTWLSNALHGAPEVPISSDGGLCFAFGNNPDSCGAYAPLPGISADLRYQAVDARTYASLETGRPLDEGETAAFYLVKGLSFIGRDPVGWLLLEGKKALLLLGGRDVRSEYSLVRERRDYLPQLWAFPVGGTVVLLLAALAAGSGDQVPTIPGSSRLLTLLGLGQALTSLIFHVGNRFTLPFHYLLIPLAATGLARASFRGARRPLTIAAAALILGAGIATPLIQSPSVDEGIYQNNLGSLLLEQGDRAGAEEAFRRSLQANPGSPAAMAGLGSVRLEAGDLFGAESLIRGALALDPANIRHLTTLSRVQMEGGRLREALVTMDRALAIHPSSARLRVLKADLLLRNGSVEEASSLVQEVLSLDPSDPGALLLRDVISSSGP